MLEYKRLKQNDLFSTIKRSIISANTLTVLAHNVRLLSKHVDDILSDDEIIINDMIGLIEAQISLSGSTCKIIEALNLF